MLKVCLHCQRLFPNDASHCAADGKSLVSAADAPLPSSPDDPLVGYTLADRFQIRRIIADGGMGRVYEARSLRDERRVAVKVLHSEIADDPVNLERFRREASTSKDLDHTYTVEVIEFASVPTVPGRARRTHYLVMEYLDGEELRSLLDREKTISFATVVRMISQIALALDPAHEAGLVHRDLKPDNVFLVQHNNDIRAKILDFGSVKFTKGQDRANKLTIMGTTIGSPHYMAPEQAQGSPDLDHRADTWAITIIAYEMLVGRVPYRGQNGPQVLFKILSDEPEPPSFVDETLPPAFDTMILKGLKRAVADRYQSVGELADELGKVFGLTGSHKEWAELPTLDLVAHLPRSKPPPVLDITRSDTLRPSAPAPAPVYLPTSRAPIPRVSDPDEVRNTTDVLPAVVVKPPVPVWVLVVGAVVILGILAVVALR
jgi:eukaryotic-like serine/threonine-protein kinase